MTSITRQITEGTIPLDFNWNSELHPDSAIPTLIPASPLPEQLKDVVIVDEGLRDGLGSAKKYPSVESMESYIQTAYEFGIRTMTVGIYPGTGNRIDRSIRKILSILRSEFPSITPIVLSLATNESLQWLGECRQIHAGLNAIVFIGTSPSRMLVEEWTPEYVLEKLAWATKTAVQSYHVDVIGATEHTTQTPPGFLRDIVRTLVTNGASKFCIADTIGIARPIGAYRITAFVRSVLSELGRTDIPIDWHGHDDIHNAVANSLTAISAGAKRIHTVVRGRGERAGNTMMEGVVLNIMSILDDAGHSPPWKVSKLAALLESYDHVTGAHPPVYGTLGENAFKTSLGIHTAAMHKAAKLIDSLPDDPTTGLKRKMEKMARQIYTAIDPHSIGRQHQIVVSPWSGATTVELAYRMTGGTKELSIEVIQHILLTAKRFGRELTTEELHDLCKEIE